MKEAVQFEFTGAIVPDSFEEFARHRAKRLDIWLKICSNMPEAVTLDVQGDADLVDAFEMACSLGPQDCIILDVSRRQLPDYDLERT